MKTKLGRALGKSHHEDRCIGCLLGVACGDILGANLEFKTQAEILSDHGRVEDFLDSSWRPLGRYTDDTEMTLALATSLIECKQLSVTHCATTYARFFASEPRRGYGPAASLVLEALCDGADPLATGRLVYPEGSFANGGVMRIAPVGLAFRNAPDQVLREAIRRALVCTHVHPDAMDSAAVQAKAVARLCSENAVHTQQFLADLAAAAHGGVLRSKLTLVAQAVMESCAPQDFLGHLCTPNEYGAAFQIHAAEALCCGLWSFVCHPDDPEECIIEAVNLGGDTDTVGAITGALAGARHGTAWIPRRWYDQIENESGFGRDAIISTARKLSELDLRTCNGQ